LTSLDDTLQARQDDADWQRQQIGFDELSSGVTIRGLEYWNALRGARRFAARKNVNPRDVSPSFATFGSSAYKMAAKILNTVLQVMW
jgi:hypothetical protein